MKLTNNLTENKETKEDVLKFLDDLIENIRKDKIGLIEVKWNRKVREKEDYEILNKANFKEYVFEPYFDITIHGQVIE